MTAAARFRANVTLTLSQLPFRTPRGVVQRTRRGAHFGTPRGGHDPLDCWVYSAYESDLELMFAFYSNFSPDDLICKIVLADQVPMDGEGATLQFNGNENVEDDGVDQILRHHGLVTVGRRIARADLLERIGVHASEADAALGGIEFPLFCGSTADVGSLLDRLFLYSYAIEQAKRSFRQESALPALYAVAPFERRTTVAPTAPGGQGFSTSAAVRRAVELRAMEVARAQLDSTWEEVVDVSAHEPFDFLCRSGTRVLHVEVKGTTQDGSVVMLTRNEVEHARTHPESTALIVVSHIEIREQIGCQPVASGGQVQHIEPWHVDEAVLVPLTYACSLRP